ncbi:DUF5819 family protein [Streptomyces sp. JH34]|uniref:DUF5819 family protein n=1 Tax=Streptomyces sp. JH34 TaxID=2793633 RepID=UPI0023F7EF75|nr:DUF5819 family protein [Streptomyces sp. JH34]MDF6020633.1 DUF5819 family protein [Streptomyces sp. JH34]
MGATTMPDGWSGKAVAALMATALVLAGALLVHLALVFLSIAPANAASARHRETVDGYVQPAFGQDWKLFAPNPMQRNEAVGVRMRTRGEAGGYQVGEWVNLTAQDVETVRGNPAPSHLNQNMLRRAWDAYVANHSLKNDIPKGARGRLAADYLKRVVLQRTGPTWDGRPIVSIQVAGRFALVDPPAWSPEEPSDTTDYRLLRWWPVTQQDHRGL